VKKRQTRVLPKKQQRSEFFETRTDAAVAPDRDNEPAGNIMIRNGLYAVTSLLLDGLEGGATVSDLGIAGHRPTILIYTIQFPRAWACVLSSEHLERRLAAILGADVARYSRLMGADEEGALPHLKSFKKCSSIPKSLSIVDASSRRLVLRSLPGDKRTFAGIVGPQKYNGKNMANSHRSLSVFASLELRGFNIAVVRAAIKAGSDVHRTTRLE
jgi:hypothetical protein